MKADFSEFTYGFSLVSELASALSCTAVPIFPSLVEEGREGGGYDVKLLTSRGKILNFQFKLSERMKATSSREHNIPGHGLSLPYYRFAIASGLISRQHPLLLALEDIEPLTFYAAPKFHENEEINERWKRGAVTEGSVFVRPSSIGGLPDLNPHRICFDCSSIARGKAYFFSEPKEIDILSLQDLSECVFSAVDKETGTLEDSLHQIRERYTSALASAHRRIRRQLLHASSSDSSAFQRASGKYRLDDHFSRDVERLNRILSGPADGLHLLRQIAQVTSGIFGALAIAVAKV